MTRWRVTQYTAQGALVHSKSYRLKFWARVIAWTFSGWSITGDGRYQTRITEER